MNVEIDKSYFIVLATIGFVIFFVITLLIFVLPHEVEAGHILIGIITGILGILMYPWQILDAMNRKYILEDKTVIYRSGIITRYEAEIPYTSIKGISTSQGIINRIVGCADIRITSPGIQDPHLISSADTNSLCLRSIKNYKDVSIFLKDKMKG
jgi:uncharacterized membrane protein YdbT with pleckstrin-like domain